MHTLMTQENKNITVQDKGEFTMLHALLGLALFIGVKEYVNRPVEASKCIEEQDVSGQWLKTCKYVAVTCYITEHGSNCEKN